jgi:PHD/YefM family antitoxin component YafN of YafNO toxin-antitoxin module
MHQRLLLDTHMLLKRSAKQVKMSVITATEIKRRGVACIAESLPHTQEVAISVRGKNAYIAMSMEQYNHLRACVLEASLHKKQRDMAQGAIAHRSVAEHIGRLDRAYVHNRFH